MTSPITIYDELGIERLRGSQRPPGGGSLTVQTGGLPPGAGDGNVTPEAIGALYLDIAVGALYIAGGVTAADWLAVGGLTYGGSDSYSGVASEIGGETRLTGGPQTTIGDAHAASGLGNRLQWNLPGADGSQYLILQLGNAGQFNHFWGSDGTYTAPGGIIFPTSDPLVAGAWWDNMGVLTKSTGP